MSCYKSLRFTAQFDYLRDRNPEQFSLERGRRSPVQIQDRRYVEQWTDCGRMILLTLCAVVSTVMRLDLGLYRYKPRPISPLAVVLMVVALLACLADHVRK